MKPSFDLLRDKLTINAMVEELAGEHAASVHVAETAKAQKEVIRRVCGNERPEEGEQLEAALHAVSDAVLAKRARPACDRAVERAQKALRQEILNPPRAGRREQPSFSIPIMFDHPLAMPLAILRAARATSSTPRRQRCQISISSAE